MIGAKSGELRRMARGFRAETAGGGRGLAMTLFALRLYIVAAVAVWFQT